MTTTTKKTWAQLRVGDRFACPVCSGRVEAVRRTPEKRPGGLVFVRTSAHDHLKPKHETVELLFREEQS